ncbi:hypothetical protein IFM89_036656 [Coptis chinensis]|uniref:Protein kinase domain-containing protein n=1 Tax=Coptis chinensis TaxID=261450 RepID=A0A835LXG6_9MAGN|nr:hypothetical protein IFM89_036656 [Coptis chinensis]
MTGKSLSRWPVYKIYDSDTKKARTEVDEASFEVNRVYLALSSSTSGFIQLTTNRRDANVLDEIGRSYLSRGGRLWDSDCGEVADFTTHFSFTISMLNPNGSNIPPDNNDGGDGLAFFLAPKGSTIPPDSATGESYEFHNILSWDFNSPELPSSPAVTNRGTGNGGGQQTGGREDKCTIKLVIDLVVGGSVLAAGLGLVFFVWRERSIQKKDEEDVLDISTDEDYEKGTGPKRFNYGELAHATSNFTEEGYKLGEGGFGGVYRGILSDSNEVVPVKKISRGSRQGKKEFVSKVKIISQLR